MTRHSDYCDELCAAGCACGWGECRGRSAPTARGPRDHFFEQDEPGPARESPSWIDLVVARPDGRAPEDRRLRERSERPSRSEGSLSRQHFVRLPDTGSCSTGWAGIEAQARASSRAFPAARKDRKGKASTSPASRQRTGLVRARWPVTDTFRFPRTRGQRLLSCEARAHARARPRQGHIHPPDPALRCHRGVRRSSCKPQSTPGRLSTPGAARASSRTNSTKRIPANHVSFDRPYRTAGPTPLQWDIGLLRFLEREGYDVSYTTDVDTDRNPTELTRHRLVISVGQDEFWSKRMRDAFEAARSGGTNLAFLGAEIGEWQIRYEKRSKDDRQVPDRRRGPGRRPRSQGSALRGSHSCAPRVRAHRGWLYEGQRDPTTEPPQAYVVNPSALGDPWFAGTGFTATSCVTRLGRLRVGLDPAGLRGSSADGVLPVRRRRSARKSHGY